MLVTREPHDRLPVPDESGMECAACGYPIFLYEKYVPLPSGNYHKSCLNDMTTTAERE